MQDLAQMRLGFVGTGTIASAIVAGLCADPATVGRIRVSPRNPQVAARLAATFPQVSIAVSNQETVDGSDVVFLALRPQIAQEVLATLRFRPGHRIISLIATFSRDRIAALVQPACNVCCAVPMPTVAQHLGSTAIFPPDAVAAQVFNHLGIAVEVANESELQALWASSALMATYFTLLGTIWSWLTRHGVPPARAHEHVAMMFDGLSRVPRRSKASFAELAEEFKTKGGLNEQCAEELTQAGVFDACSLALDAILARIEGHGGPSRPQTPAAVASVTVGDG